MSNCIIHFKSTLIEIMVDDVSDSVNVVSETGMYMSTILGRSITV